MTTRPVGRRRADWTRSIALATILLTLPASAAPGQDTDRPQVEERRKVVSRIVITSDDSESEDSYNWVYLTEDGHTAAVPPIASFAKAACR